MNVFWGSILRCVDFVEFKVYLKLENSFDCNDECFNMERVFDKFFLY